MFQMERACNERKKEMIKLMAVITSNSTGQRTKLDFKMSGFAAY